MPSVDTIMRMSNACMPEAIAFRCPHALRQNEQNGDLRRQPIIRRRLRRVIRNRHRPLAISNRQHRQIRREAVLYKRWRKQKKASRGCLFCFQEMEIYKVGKRVYCVLSLLPVGVEVLPLLLAVCLPLLVWSIALRSAARSWPFS